VDIQERLPDVCVDATQIHQVVVNLCANAAHSMKGIKGDLQVRAELVVFAGSDIRLHPDLPPGDYVRIIVSDTGHGMDGATMSRIFEPFFTTKEQGEGTGLGLSVVHGIVRAHGGAITVESKLDMGSTFAVYLPTRR
jgi:signal transduction histidine kinase